eukprot:CAMPEP_0197589424 /NCGR_PEP_ID=MMETSP1326-20131121/10381_1 /TAXON_ID=1155430 /ORGANISM="Genus nov. species nov., Strain RCC2288" /LENGTH=342 /DNA_ID=CAMNT_0043154361 /DNA_START=77 /DNA_END=1105 /DNA_ORIENTATION=+
MSPQGFLAAVAASAAAAVLVNKLNATLQAKKSGGGGGGGQGSSRRLKNSAFVFIKPAANTAATRALVKKTFAGKGINVVSEGEIKAETIDKDMLIDQHYYAIASKATLVKPKDLPVPEDKFEAKFGLSWKKALADGQVFNALDACAKLGCDAMGLDKKWAEAKKADALVKFGGGFYCGKVEGIYVFNGFFMSMRAGFVKPGASIYYFVVEWDPKDLAWASFRGDVLGATDPAESPKGSLRAEILANWKSLGIESMPYTGENGVHASASPMEGLAERANWLKADVAKDSFGAALLAAGVSKKTIAAWSIDPQVVHPGGKGSCFDLLEDKDAAECIATCLSITA